MRDINEMHSGSKKISKSFIVLSIMSLVLMLLVFTALDSTKSEVQQAYASTNKCSVNASQLVSKTKNTLLSNLTQENEQTSANLNEVTRITMYRLYNKYTGEHFYTSVEKEKKALVNGGWTDEGTGWIAPQKSDYPVYRLYNPYVPGGDHHYTLNFKEYNRLEKVGWKKEGIGWYSCAQKDVDSVALYRQYNPYALTGTHNYTAQTKERDSLIKAGWKDEDVAWYGFSKITPTPVYTVTFNSNGGSSVASQSIVNGNKVTKPSNPTKTNLVFAGWYTSNSFSTAFDFNNSTVTSNITLYAKWTAKVKFDTGETSLVPDQQITEGGKVSKPEDPDVEGKTFQGWFTSSTYETQFDFDNTTIKANTTIYAKLVEKPAFAVYSASDKSLTFYKRENVAEEGVDYEGKVATNVYTEIEDWSGEEVDDVPWYSNQSDIESVEFADKVWPKSTKCWFYECENLSNVNTNKLNTSKVTDMSEMFAFCSSLEGLDVSNFDTSKVVNMQSMFSYCSSLKSLNLSNFNTRKVTNMRSMFYSCAVLEELNVKSFNTSCVTDMSGMFYGCIKVPFLDVSGFDTSKVGTADDSSGMKNMFCNCASLSNLDVSKFKTQNVNDMNSMFSGCASLTSLNVKSFNTSCVTDMSGMFYGCELLEELDLSSFDTTSVTNMFCMFANCLNLSKLNISSFKTPSVTDMSYMFTNCLKLNSLDLRKFNTERVTSMEGMFDMNYALQKDDGDPVPENSLTELDLSSFKTSYVQNMRCMFNFCDKLTTLKFDTSNFKTGEVTDMAYMFNQCAVLQSLDVSKFDTAKVEDMNCMFNNCATLTKIDVSGFNTASVTDMSYMFCQCTNVTQLNLETFNTSQVTTMEAMFAMCVNLANVQLNNSTFDTSNVRYMNSMFFMCGYLSLGCSGWNVSAVVNHDDFNNGAEGVDVPDAWKGE